MPSLSRSDRVIPTPVADGDAGVLGDDAVDLGHGRRNIGNEREAVDLGNQRSTPQRSTKKAGLK